MYNNNISGVIPPALGKLKSLVFLWVSHHQKMFSYFISLGQTMWTLGLLLGSVFYLHESSWVSIWIVKVVMGWKCSKILRVCLEHFEGAWLLMTIKITFSSLFKASVFKWLKLMMMNLWCHFNWVGLLKIQI